MNRQEGDLILPWKEFGFQIILHGLVLIFYSTDRENPGIETWEFVFFLNLALSAALINYILLPRLLYKKKYLSFAIALFSVIAFAFFMEEFVLEKLFFPDTRGSGFAGIFLTLLSVLPVITILTGFKFGWDAFKNQQEVEQLRLAIKESELQYLKSQINPHFLFNNLNNLYSYAIDNSPKTPEIILELSNVLRYMLYDCKSEYVALSKEIAQLQNFIRISELQVEERGQVSYNFADFKKDYKIAPLILIVFIENAFKHSTASQLKNISVDVRAWMDKEGILEFSCINSFNTKSNVDKLASGIGLENVRKRLKLSYPGKHNLKMTNTENEYRVYLTLDLN